MTVNATVSTFGNTTAQTFLGKVPIWIRYPSDVIAAGYTTIRLEYQKKRGDDWVERTKETTRITIQEGVYNYAFVDESALQDYRYRPVLIHTGAEPELVQPECPVIDSSFELVYSVQELKDDFLFGLDDALSDDSGVPLPDRVYIKYILAAIAKVELKCAIRVLPRKFVEHHDYVEEDMQTFGSLYTDEFPIIEVDEIALTLAGSEPQAFDSEWHQIEKEMGQIHLMPTSVASFVQRRVPPGAYGGRSNKFVPRAMRITYHAGFGGTGLPLPANIKDAIGKLASLGPLNIGGDLLGGAGIASQSISLDGLSTNFNTTSSATNAGFGARIIQYTKELKEDYKEIRDHYKGIRMRVL